MDLRLIVYADPKIERNMVIVIKPIIKRRTTLSCRCVVLLFVLFLG